MSYLKDSESMVEDILSRLDDIASFSDAAILRMDGVKLAFARIIYNSDKLVLSDLVNVSCSCGVMTVRIRDLGRCTCGQYLVALGASDVLCNAHHMIQTLRRSV